LAWLDRDHVLTKNVEVLAGALQTLLKCSIGSPEDARNVWEATPAVLGACNDQTTYERPGAAEAYAWLHLLERYARTWSALRRLVEAGCLPMAKHGVRTLDVGSGAGPSAFAVLDFYNAMTEFSILTENLKWRQPPKLTCVETDDRTNHFRHMLAELVFEQSGRQFTNVLDLCNHLNDFQAILPSENRQRYQQQLLSETDEYFDEIRQEPTSDLIYSADDANEIANSLHRYRLIVFSNFLTTKETLVKFEANLVDILVDARPGSVVMILGGKGEPYPDIYANADRLARAAGFFVKIEGESVSSNDADDTNVANQIYEKGGEFCRHLLHLAPDAAEATRESRRVKSHFISARRKKAKTSQLWAYRKY